MPRRRRRSDARQTSNSTASGSSSSSPSSTKELVDANPFDYLTELQKHGKDVVGNPAQWMPWNYRETLDQARMPQTAAD
jgi:hypothetical protein